MSEIGSVRKAYFCTGVSSSNTRSAEVNERMTSLPIVLCRMAWLTDWRYRGAVAHKKSVPGLHQRKNQVFAGMKQENIETSFVLLNSRLC